MTRFLALLLLSLGVVACSPKRLPGTDIRETPDTQAIYAVVEAYVNALNARDAERVLAHVAPDYLDDAGTPEATDDLDRAQLERAIVEDLGRVDSSKLALTLRKIEVEGDTAFAEVFYDSYYRVRTETGMVPRRDSDVNRIRLRRVEGEWKISSGL
jgi:ketosteroid isomerase-like protein